MASHLVEPREPTILSHKEYHELSSTNLLLPAVVSCHSQIIWPETTLNRGPVQQVPTAHIIPEILDIERFNIALGESLSSFPLPTGRLVRPDRPDAPWRVHLCFLPPLPRTNHGMQIRLTNSGVPVSVIDNDTDEIFPTDFTIQPTFRYTDPLNVAGIVNTEGESDEPLFRLTIARFTKLNSTSIGASRSHILCEFFLDLPSSSRYVDVNGLS